MTLEHTWQLTPGEARSLQLELATLVETSDRLGAVHRVAGVDVHFPGKDIARAAVVVLDAANLTPCDQAVVELPVRFPYVPGLLSFRETPAALAAIGRLQHLPDLIICDAHGLAHPRRMGLACHLGLLLDLPTIGAAKSRLFGTHATVGDERGATTPVRDGDESIGCVLRTRPGVRPLYVSVGHRVSLATAVAWVLRCAPRYRLPETTRHAHRLASTPADETLHTVTA